MPYPNIHRYLTVHWNVSGVTGDEEGQFGLRFDNPGAVDQDMVAACAAPVSTMWTSAGAGIESGYRLIYLRLAQIGVDGKYVPNTVSYDHVYSPVPVGGGGTTAARFPLQTALASTLVTNVPRGQASKGRVYLPWFNSALGSDYTWAANFIDTRSTAVANMIGALEFALGPCKVFSKGTKTSSAGLANTVTGVKTGRRPDVQRRRAKQVVEVYGSTIATP